MKIVFEKRFCLEKEDRRQKTEVANYNYLYKTGKYDKISILFSAHHVFLQQFVCCLLNFDFYILPA